MAVVSGFTRRTLNAQNVALSILSDYGNDVEAYGDRLEAICDDVMPKDRHFVKEVTEALDVLSGNAARRQAAWEKAKEKKYARAA